MATQIILGKGASLTYSSTSAGTYSAIAQAQSIEGVELSAEMIDQVTLASTIKKKRPGLPEAPTLTLTVFYDPTDASHIALIGAFTTPTVVWFKLLLKNPDDGTTKSTMAFPAYIDSFKQSGIETSSNVTGVFGLTLTDLPVWS